MKEEQILSRYGIVILTSCQRFLSFIDFLVTEKKEVQLFCFPQIGTHSSSSPSKHVERYPILTGGEC